MASGRVLSSLLHSSSGSQNLRFPTHRRASHFGGLLIRVAEYSTSDESCGIVVYTTIKRVSVRTWKGITLSVDQWNTLRNRAEDIDKALSGLS